MTKTFLGALLGLLLLAPPATADTTQETLRAGPFEVGAYGVEQDTVFPPTPGRAGYITQMHARMVDEAGEPIPVQRLMLHHAMFANDGGPEGLRHDGSCPDLPRERFYTTGEENRTLSLPYGYGYRTEASDRWRLAFMLMNHSPRPERAYIEYTVTMTRDENTRPVKPFWLDVARCRGGSIYSVPGGGRGVDRRTADLVLPFDGRIVAAGSHLHGGATDATLEQPTCDDREVLHSRPRYGLPAHPYYNVLPVLHEPGPVATGWFTSGEGIAVRRGERMRFAADYDAVRPHARVMAMLHVYVARDDDPPPEPCGPLPSDAREDWPFEAARWAPPPITVPLTGIGRDGTARVVDRPAGRRSRLGRGTTLTVRGRSFPRKNLSIPEGATMRWRFTDRERHGVTTANGPRAFSSRNLRGGATYQHRFAEPGTYRLLCALHPAEMTQLIHVREDGKPDRAAR